MPKLSFTFSGYVNDALIEKAISVETLREVDVSHMTAEELRDKIEEGELAISFVDAYAEGDGNIEMRDFSTNINPPID